MIRLSRLLVLSLLILVAGACTSPVEVDNQRRPVVVDPGVLTGQLENGFAYYLRSANGAAENDRLELRLVVKAGSIHEGPGQRGYAHLVEHMAYRGTKSFSLDDIEALLSDNGLRWGVDVNALTHYGATVYRFSLHQSDEHLLPEVLSLMAEWLDSISFEPFSLEKEKRIVGAELRERYAVRGYVVDPVTVSAYAGSRYENRQPAGDLTNFQRVSSDGLRRYWDRTYRPDNAVLIITGANKPWQYEPMITSAFSGLSARPTSVIEAGATQVLDGYVPIDANNIASGVKYFKDGVLVELMSSSDPEISLPSLSVNLISKPKAPISNIESSVALIKERFRSQLLFSAFSYLVRDRIANTQACSAIDVNASLLESGQAVEKVKITLTEDVMLECLSVAYDAVKVVRSSRLTDEEFAEFQDLFAQIAQLSVDQYRGRTANELASGLVDMVANGEVLVSAWDMQNILGEVTSAMDLNALNTMIKNITESHRLMFSAVSDTEQPPSIEAMIAAVNKPHSSLSTRVRSTVTHGVLNLDQTRLPERDGNYAKELGRSIASLLPDEQLIRSMPDLSSVEKVRTRGNYHEWRLKNGATVILLQDSEYDHIALTAISDGGYARRSGASAVATKSLPDYLSVNGVNGYTGRSLRKIMIERNIYVEPYIDAFHHGIEASGSAQELPAIISIAGGFFTDPLVVEPQSSIFLEHRNVGKAQDDWPGSVWQRVIGGVDKNLPGNTDMNVTVHFAESFVSNDLFIQTHKSLYGSTKNFGFIFVGSVEPEELERELHGLIIGSESENIELYRPDSQSVGQSEENISKDFVDNTALINHGEKRTDISLVLSCNAISDFNGASSDSDTGSHSLWHWKIFSDVIAEKFRFALREEGGFVYDIESNVPASRKLLQKLSFSVRPEDADEVLSVISDVFAQLSSNGVSESAMLHAVARDKRLRMLDAADYKSVALRGAQQWLARGKIHLDDNLSADIRHLNKMTRCLNEPLQQILVGSNTTHPVNSDPAIGESSSRNPSY